MTICYSSHAIFMYLISQLLYRSLCVTEIIQYFYFFLFVSYKYTWILVSVFAFFLTS